MDEFVSGNAAVPEEEESFDYRHYGELLLKYWKLVVGCVAISCGLAALSAFLAAPIFRAATMIIVEGEKVSLSDMGLGQSAFSVSDPDFLPTQQRIITGREVLESVISRRQLLKGRGADKPLAASPGGAEPSAEMDRMVRDISSGLQVTLVRGTLLIEIAYMAHSGKESAAMANAVADAYIDWNRKSRIDQVTQVSRFLESQIEELKKDVEEKERKLAAFGKSRDIVSMDSGKTISMQKLETFSKDYAAAVGERINKEARYQQISTMSPEAIADQDQSVAAARAEQQKIEREYAEKLSIWKPDFPAMKQLKARVEKGQKYLETVSAEAAGKARQQARVELESARKREEVLRDVLRSQTNETLGQTVDAVEFANLRVEISASRTLLDSMLKRQAETEVVSRVSGMRQANVRVVERAVPPEFRTYPSYRHNLQIGLLTGLLLGIGLVVLIDRLDRSIRSQVQVEKILQLPALGTIPSFGSPRAKGYGYSWYGDALRRYGYGYGYGSKKRGGVGDAAAAAPGRGDAVASEEKASIELITHNQPRSVVSEAYRAFRAMLLLSRAGGLNAVVVTSAVPGEGKTTTALNLGVTLAQLGKKVLLLDCDLHKPRVHKVLKVTNRVGMSSLLVEGVSPKEAVQATAVPNLWVVTAGPTTPNPSGLLSSEAMKQFLEVVKTRFDFVVIDSPPVQPVADALILASLTDGVVLTIHGGKTSREVILKARRKLTRGKVSVLGVLINDLPMTRSRVHEYVGYAGYGGYGYGPDEGGTAGEPSKKSGETKAATA